MDKIKKIGLSFDNIDVLNDIYINLSNISKMLKNRGISEESVDRELGFDYNEFIDYIKQNGDKLPVFIIKDKNIHKTYFIIIVPKKTIHRSEVQNMVSLFESLENENDYRNHILFVVHSKSKTYVQKTLSEIRKKNHLIYELFPRDFFNEDKASNINVPRMEKMTPEEIKREILDSRLDIKNLEIMYKNDIMSQYYGFENGDIIRIYRKSVNEGITIAYRQVRYQRHALNMVTKK